MKVQIKTGWLSAITLAGSAVIAACGSLGEGVLPVSAVLQPFGGVEGATSTKAFSCLTTGVVMFVDFSNGSRGDFTSRATYTSSNPAVAKVSNFDIAVPETTNAFYNRGTIVPVSEGTATITASYLSFTRSIEVTVGTPQNFVVNPASADLAANSKFDFSVTADLDGVTTALDPLVLWSIVTPNTAVATIDATTGTVTGVSKGAGLTARARIPGCDMFAEAPLEVADLQSLALTREFGDKDSLIVGTTERLIATGTLDNGKTQDLSAQVSYTTSDATAISLFTSGISNLGLALKASTPVAFSASFASPSVTAPSISITPVTDSLNTVAVTPLTTDVAAGRTAQFSAIGTFASGGTQEITRHVAWTSSDVTAAVVQSSTTTVVNGFAGLANTAVAAAGKTVTVTATTTNAASQSISAAATLNLISNN